MTQFENAPFNERKKYLGDTSEAAFETWANKNGIPFARMGFLRPAIKLFKVDERLRLMPDYICEGKDITLVEVKGCGNEGLKIKLESLDVMGFWNDNFHKVLLFIYNSSTKKCSFVDWEEMDFLTVNKDVHTFPDKSKKKYYIIPIDELQWNEI